MRIVYIGSKSLKADNVSHSGLVWARGEIHEVVDPKKAEKLLEHPHVWADADKPYKLEPELAVVAPVQKNLVAYTANENHMIPVNEHVFAALKAGKLVVQFVTPERLEAFAEWEELDRQTKPEKGKKGLEKAA